MEIVTASKVRSVSILIAALLLIFAPLYSLHAQPQEIAELNVYSGEYDRNNTPVSASLNRLPLGLQTGQDHSFMNLLTAKNSRLSPSLILMVMKNTPMDFEWRNTCRRTSNVIIKKGKGFRKFRRKTEGCPF